MLKPFLLVLLTLVIAIGGGIGSVFYALDGNANFGAIEIGPWVASPEIGTAEADPYARARYAREGELALGQAEGVEFRATADSSGERLNLRCCYRLEGATPPARYWTLYATDENKQPLEGIGSRRPATSSLGILRQTDNSSFTITVGSEPAAGNWMPVTGAGSMQLVLTLYDTPLANRSDVSDSVLPSIRRVACNG